MFFLKVNNIIIDFLYTTDVNVLYYYYFFIKFIKLNLISLF